MDNAVRRVLVTGGAGYVGSVLVPQLLHRGYAVRVLDNLRWEGTALLGVAAAPAFEFQAGDVRDRDDVARAVRDVDAVVHLAAIVGDPACRLEPALAEEINLTASLRLLDAARAARVGRFVFASTCSNYGRMADAAGYCDETTPLRPVSLYAELKVKFEEHLLGTADGPCATSLRFATAYGLSSRMRFDLTLNEFTRDATAGKELIVYGEQFWRPYAHTTDLARACLHVLERPERDVHRQAFNVGDDAENYQKAMLVQEITKQIPGLRFRYVHKDEDPRDYRVSFEKIRALGFRIARRIPDGIREISAAIRTGLIRDPYDKKYVNA
ncbi:MAG: epimerase [Elusimicrobia bacterium GWA2_69_24]|nr:MAG: epimerase [Candidatus Rokubacteria bacterium RBG_16_73_20]OGR60931.1 MAG: epimerase [Elusimicrobia bacterium GWA2_69_24]HBH00780.1 epimerase [Candidatus Rokubacteria bacterium]